MGFFIRCKYKVKVDNFKLIKFVNLIKTILESVDKVLIKLYISKQETKSYYRIIEYFLLRVVEGLAL